MALRLAPFCGILKVMKKRYEGGESIQYMLDDMIAHCRALNMPPAALRYRYGPRQWRSRRFIMCRHRRRSTTERWSTDLPIGTVITDTVTVDPPRWARS